MTTRAGAAVASSARSRAGARGTSRARKLEFGDYQTPLPLARRVCERLAELGLRPASVVEPTCGQGNFLVAALAAFPELCKAVGLERDREHLDAARAALGSRVQDCTIELECGDFYRVDWNRRMRGLPDPLLVLGNPPWVTSAVLGSLGGKNAPPRAPLAGLTGLEALTGRSNFDVSEWMLSKSLASISGRRAALAVLCKRSVARKVLLRAWTERLRIARARLFGIDAAKYFGASVDACLLLIEALPDGDTAYCDEYAELDDNQPVRRFGFDAGRLVKDLDAHARSSPLEANRKSSAGSLRWRSGIKHDCAPVMELRIDEGGLLNGFGQRVDLEPEQLFPLRKGSELGARRSRRMLIVPQRSTAESTDRLRLEAPKTWAYLESHRARLDSRASRIYRGRARFAIFGVGPYSFSPWKVAIAGLYKRLEFHVLGPEGKKPVVLDDTSYFLPCASRASAEQLARCLGSSLAREFFEARVFWDHKRPITIDLLARLDIERLRHALEMVSPT